MSTARIRRLLSQRQPRSTDGVGYGEQNDTDSVKPSRKESWFTSRRPQSRKRPPTPPSYQQAAKSARCPGPLTASTNRDPTVTFLVQLSLQLRPPWGVCFSQGCGDKDDWSDRSYRLSSATSYGSEGPSFLTPSKEPERAHRLVPHKTIGSGSSLGSFEALSSNPPDHKEIPPVQEVDNNESSSDLSITIQRLVQETDQAFKAVGSALAESKTMQNSYNETPRLPPLDLEQDPQPTTPRTFKHSPKRPSYSVYPKVAAPPVLERKASVTRPKRTNSKRTKQMKPQRKVPAVKYVPKQPGTRLKISENVSGLFSGRRFKKIEADEMLTPTQIEQYRLRRLSKLKTETSEDTTVPAESESTDTPIDPFNMDDLPSRIGSSGVKWTDTPVDDKPDPDLFGEPVKQDFSIQQGDDELFLGSMPDRPAPPIPGDERSSKHASFPAPPPKSHLRGMPRKQLPALPAIPELTVSTEVGDELFIETSLTPRDSEYDEEFVFLRSSPCTITVPLFKHGPIRLSKSDLIPDPKLGAEEGLDWTAFQMAILGGAGDWFSDSEDTIRQRDAEEVADLMDWWDEWHFERTGGLVKKETEPAAPSPTSTESGEDYSDFSYSDIERDNPYSPDHRWQQTMQRAAAEGRSLELSMPPRATCHGFWDEDHEKLYNGGGVQRWTTEGGKPERESLLSLPQSPMLDFTLVTSDNGDVDFVPMGYNLGHDLGDFLKWEAENVYSDDTFWDGGVI
ncbi:Sporulation protein Zds1 [Apiospora arundinis]